MPKRTPSNLASNIACSSKPVRKRLITILCRCRAQINGRCARLLVGYLPAGTIFVGAQTGDDLAVALASADVFLNPSITEAFGNVTQEAMACGLPVVAALATGATSLVRDGVTGILVDPLQPDQYGDALASYAADPALRAKHGNAGLDFAKTRDWDAINADVMKLYTRVIDRRARMDALYGKRWLPS